MRRALMLLVAAVMLLACGGFVPDRRADCREEGRCGVRTHRAGDAVARTYVRDSADCRQSLACAQEGRCWYDPSVHKEACVALTDLDCRESEGCRERGACAVNERGECRVEETGCQRHQGCAEEGVCRYEISQTCVEGPPDCKEACRLEGACELGDDGICQAVSDEDCERSHFCWYAGQCTAQDGRCVATEESCRDQSWCENNGHCQQVTIDGEPGDWCGPEGHVCDGECRVAGRCTWDQGICAAVSDEDCAGSLGCEIQGLCGRQRHGVCLVSAQGCRESLECQAFGRCEKGAADCVDPKLEGPDRWAWKANWCLGAEACETEGRCFSAPDGTCLTAEEAGVDWTPR